MKTALAILFLLPCAALASEPSLAHPAMKQQPSPIDGVPHAMKRLKLGMDLDAALRQLPIKSPKLIGFPVTSPTFVRYYYDLGQDHVLMLEFDPPPIGQPFHHKFATAEVRRGGRIIAKVGK